MERNYLVWSNEHSSWWGPNHNDYVTTVKEAGRYTRDEALSICISAMPGRFGSEPMHEIPVLLEDALTMLRTFKQAYPKHNPEPESR